MSDGGERRPQRKVDRKIQRRIEIEQMKDPGYIFTKDEE